MCSRTSVFPISLSVSFVSLASLLSAFLSPLLCSYFSLVVSQFSSSCLYCCIHLSLFLTYLSLFSPFCSILSSPLLPVTYSLSLSLLPLYVGLFAIVSLYDCLLISLSPLFYLLPSLLLGCSPHVPISFLHLSVPMWILSVSVCILVPSSPFLCLSSSLTE